jgi:hypothetical protein
MQTRPVITQEEYEMYAALAVHLAKEWEAARKKLTVRAAKGNPVMPMCADIADAYSHQRDLERKDEFMASMFEVGHELVEAGFPMNIRVKYESDGEAHWIWVKKSQYDRSVVMVEKIH